MNPGAGHQLALDLPLPPRKAPPPPAGVIVGGKFDGWAYVLIEVRQVGTRRYPVVRASEPGWPFTRLIEVRPPARLESK